MKTPRPTASLAPFVGVALAALTIGSLVTFSLVAQRASLEGFSARGVVVAEAPSASSPPSIVLPGTSPTSPDADDKQTDAQPAPAATALLVATTGEDTTPVTGVNAAPQLTAGADDPFPARERGSLELPGGPVNASRSGGGSANAGDDKVKEAKKDKKAKKAKKAKSHVAAAPPESRGRPDHAGPPSKSKPARAPKPKSTPVANGHEKARGEGHSKGRGRGHDKHH